MKKALGGLILLLLVAAVVAAGGGFWFVHSPASSSTEEVVLDIPRGASVRSVSELLAENGLVRSAPGFRYYVKIKGASAQLRAGEFRFRRDLTPAQVLETILHAQRVLHKLTIPEGLTAKEIAKIVGESGLGSGEEFLRLTEDASFAKSLGVPAARLEGYLFPDTYELEKGAGAKLIATTMVKHFQAVWTPELAAKAKANGLDETQAVTLASIVEKETGAPEERPMIAGVFYNRLKKKMRLESDPTIIYGLKDYDGNIRKGDIHDPKNVYNTYVIKGLPPGPIANPGAESLKAIADPKKHDFIFFVATGEGRHVFAATLKEHEANVDKYQRHRTQGAQTAKKSGPG